MGLGILHHSPLWAQSDKKLTAVYRYKTMIDSVWDLVLYIGDRMKFDKGEKLNSMSQEIILSNPMMNPCFMSGSFEKFILSLSLLVQGYPFYKASNKQLMETDQSASSPYTGEAVSEDIEVVQIWIWYEIGEVCCKTKVPSDDPDDWFSGVIGMAITPYSFSVSSLYDYESLLEDEEPYTPTKRYPLGTWDQLDLQQYLSSVIAGMGGGCGGGLFGGSGGLFGSEYKYTRHAATRLKWQWDFYKIKTNDFASEAEAQEAYEDYKGTGYDYDRWL